MGNQIVAAGATTINMPDISANLNLIAPLGGRRRGRFFTSLRCESKSDGADIVIKVVVRMPDDKVQSAAISAAADELSAFEYRIRTSLRQLVNEQQVSQPCNVLHYTTFSKSDRFCLLQRPYVHYSVPERLQVRPYWSAEERLFACFQLLHALRQLHDTYGCTHGDVKAENVLVTTTGWVYLTDASSPFKPSQLESYNPAKFEFYYDNSESRHCCIAPEKFFDESSGPPPEGDRKHTPAMDVFSAACVIVHILSDEPLFKLSGILEFKSKSDEKKREHLTQLFHARNIPPNETEMLLRIMCSAPESRPTAAELLRDCTPSVFPPYFALLHANVLPALLTAPPDAQVHMVWSRFEDIMLAAERCERDADYAFEMARVSGYNATATAAGSSSSAGASAAPDIEKERSGERARHEDSGEVSSDRHGGGKRAEIRRNVLALVAPTVTVAAKHVKTEEAQCKAVMLLQRCAQWSSDWALRDLLLPHALYFVRDPDVSPFVRAAALRALTEIASYLQGFPPSESLLYEDLVFPSLSDAVRDPHPCVAVEAALCIPKLMRLALGNLHRRQTLAGGSEWLHGFDFQLHIIVDRGWDLIRGFFNHEDSSVVCAVLSSVPTIVECLGPEKCVDDLFPLLVTVMGCGVIDVKREMVRQVVNIALAVPVPRPETVLLLVEEGLGESDIECICVSLDGVSRLLERGALPTDCLTKLVQHCAPLLAHPDRWVQRAVKETLKQASLRFADPDIFLNLECALRPLLTRYVPLCSLGDCPGIVRSEVLFSKASDAAPCGDYLDRVDNNPGTVRFPRNAVPKTVGDLTKDVYHADVGPSRHPSLRHKDPTALVVAAAAASMASTSATAANANSSASVAASPNSSPHPRRPLESDAAEPQPDGEEKNTTESQEEEKHGDHAGSSSDNGDVWRMDQFKATARQQKRIVMRSWTQETVQHVPHLLRHHKSSVRSSGVYSSPRDGQSSHPNLAAAGAGGGGMSASSSPQQHPHHHHPHHLHHHHHVPESSRIAPPAKPSSACLAAARDNPTEDGGGGPVLSLAHSGGWLASVGRGTSVRLWDVAEVVSSNAHGKAGVMRPIVVSGALQSATCGLHVDFLKHDGGRRVAVGTDNGLLVEIDVDSQQFAAQTALSALGPVVTSFSLPTSALSLCGCADGFVHAVDHRASASVWRSKLDPAHGAVTAMMPLSSSSAGTYGFVCGTSQGAVCLFDLRVGVQVSNFSVPHHAHVHSICADPTSANSTSASSASSSSSAAPSILVSSRAGITRYDLSSSAATLALVAGSGATARTIIHVPRSHLVVSGSDDGFMRVWDFARPEHSYTVHGGLKNVLSGAASPSTTNSSSSSSSYHYTTAMVSSSSASANALLGGYEYSKTLRTLSEVAPAEKLALVDALHADVITKVCVVGGGGDTAGSTGGGGMIAAAGVSGNVVSATRDGVIRVWHNTYVR